MLYTVNEFIEIGEKTPCLDNKNLPYVLSSFLLKCKNSSEKKPKMGGMAVISHDSDVYVPVPLLKEAGKGFDTPEKEINVIFNQLHEGNLEKSYDRILKIATYQDILLDLIIKKITAPAELLDQDLHTIVYVRLFLKFVDLRESIIKKVLEHYDSLVKSPRKSYNYISQTLIWLSFFFVNKGIGKEQYFSLLDDICQTENNLNAVPIIYVCAKVIGRYCDDNGIDELNRYFVYLRDHQSPEKMYVSLVNDLFFVRYNDWTEKDPWDSYNINFLTDTPKLYILYKDFLNGGTLSSVSTRGIIADSFSLVGYKDVDPHQLSKFIVMLIQPKDLLINKLEEYLNRSSGRVKKQSIFFNQLIKLLYFEHEKDHIKVVQKCDAYYYFPDDVKAMIEIMGDELFDIYDKIELRDQFKMDELVMLIRGLLYYYYKDDFVERNIEELPNLRLFERSAYFASFSYNLFSSPFDKGVLLNKVKPISQFLLVHKQHCKDLLIHVPDDHREEATKILESVFSVFKE